MAGATLPILSALVDKSLLRWSPAEALGTDGRYHIHELLRQYAAEKLKGDLEEKESVYDRHSGYYCAALKGWGEDLKGPDQIKALAKIGADLGNALVAWEWAAANKQVNRLAGALYSLCQFLSRQARYEEGERICQTVQSIKRSVSAFTLWAY